MKKIMGILFLTLISFMGCEVKVPTSLEVLEESIAQYGMKIINMIHQY